MTFKECQESFFKYINLGSELMEKVDATPNGSDKLILSWAVYFCAGTSAKITEAYLIGNLDDPDPIFQLRSNLSLNNLHDMRVAHLQNDGTAWN